MAIQPVITQQVQELYIAYFARAADTYGLEYWAGILDGDPANPALDVIAAAFAASAEYRADYAQSTNGQKVAAVYQNLFGRTPETAGLTYWSDLMDKQTLSVDQMVTAIAAGAQTTDLYAYDAKVNVATAITTALDTLPEIMSYTGTNANAFVKAYIATVKDPASYAIAIAPAAIDELICQFSGNPGPVPPAAAGDAITVVGFPQGLAEGGLY